MEFVFDELKQYIVKQITDTISIKDQKYLNLTKNKKYLIVHYQDNLDQIKVIEYAGRFSHMSPYYAVGYECYMKEDYAFFGIYRENKVIDSVSNPYSTYHLANDFNSYNYYDQCAFYELEDSFCKQNCLNTYSHIVTNNNLNGISNTIDIRLTKMSMHIFLIDISDQICLDSVNDYDFISDDDDNNNDDNNNNDNNN